MITATVVFLLYKWGNISDENEGMMVVLGLFSLSMGVIQDAGLIFWLWKGVLNG